MTRIREWLEFAAGSSIGLLVGLIAGLSISPVTSTILGALSTGLLILLGFKESKEGVQTERHMLRVLGFGLFCSVFLLVGINLRTRQVLSPPLEKQKQRLKDADIFTDADIEQILLSTNFGLKPATKPGTVEVHPLPDDGKKRPGDTQGEPSKTTDTARAGSADLAYAGILRAGSVEFCQTTRREQFKDVRAYLDAVRRRDNGLAHVIETVPKDYQDDLSKSLNAYICP